MAHFNGQADDDDFVGGAHHDTFNLSQGGEDSADGDGGNDLFRMHDALDAGDALDGGTGNDKVVLKGDYSAGLTLGATTLVNIESLRLGGAFDYSLTTNDGNVAAGERLSVNATALGIGNHLTFDGSAELDGHFAVFASAGDDLLTGGARGDRFFLTRGGTDIAHGGGGNDSFRMDNAFDPSDQLDGGVGYDTVVLDGNNYYDKTFNANTIHDIEAIVMKGANQYFLKLDNGNVDPGEHLLLDASASTGLTAFWGAETDGGSYTMIAGSGIQCNLYGGNGNDVLDARHTSGAAFISLAGNGGDDVMYFGANFTSNAQADGGTGNDTLVFDGDYGAFNINGSASDVRNVETVKFLAGHDYGTFFDAVTVTNDLSSTGTTGATSGLTVTYDGSELTFFDTFHLDTSGSTAAAQILKGGGGSDDLTGNANNDTFIGGVGRDSMHGGAGHDTFVVNDVSESTSWLYDAPVGIDFDNDKIDLNIAAPAAIDTAFSGGTLNQNSQSEFDSAMEASVDSTKLAAGHAVIWTPDDGAYNGYPMLIVDGNNTAGYQAGQDYIFFISGFSGTLDTGDFI